MYWRYDEPPSKVPFSYESKSPASHGSAGLTMTPFIWLFDKINSGLLLLIFLAD